jgi:hypothetical protein
MSEDGFRHAVDIPSVCDNCNLPVQGTSPYCVQCNHDLIEGPKRLKALGILKRCVYCERNAKMSREDIFPSWLARVFDNRRELPVNRVRKATEGEFFSDVQPTHYVAAWNKDRTRPTYRLFTDRICETCNNGWMSKLQAEAKPLILRLINHMRCELSEAECRTLSRWAAMTFTNIAFADQQESTLQYQRSALMSGEMSSGWNVSVAKLDTRRHAGQYERYSALMPIGGARGTATAFDSGWLVIENLGFAHFHTESDMTLALIPYSFKTGSTDHLKGARTNLIWPINERPLKLFPRRISIASLHKLSLGDRS